MLMKKSFNVISNILLLVLLFQLIGCEMKSSNKEELVSVTGTQNPIIQLDGTWKFSMTPPKEFWKTNINLSDWKDILVPGECGMQGFPIKHDVPYVYKTIISIPEDYDKKNVRLKFDGVYSYSRVWVNGEFIREHKGGFTAWECDITNFVNPGENAELTVEVTDKKDDISYGSGYAKHQIGGILRSVWLKALPLSYFEYLYIDTELDNNYQNAKLKVSAKLSNDETSFIGFELYDTSNNKIELVEQFQKIKNGKNTFTFKIANPLKWDAEHPNLYTIKTKLFDEDKKLTYSISEKIGFREIEVEGNKMLVNGKPIKLRGACRHDIHPLLGRTSTPEYDLKDVLLAKESNMNFIRTSHYPPSETFLNYCDQYGIYVEDESAVCFVNTHRMSDYNKLKQSGPEFEDQYLSQVEEMVHYHRNHPSVIIWSIGNESKYDEHIQKSYDYIKSVDSTRPVISSYPGLVPDSVKCYDILSMHYPSYTGSIWPQYGIGLENFEYQKMPALFDEWAHVACYNLPTLRTDPNVREFWGRSLDSMWMNIFESEGGLGGAIWGYIDETFMMPQSMEGFDDWWGVQELKGGEKVYKGPTIGYGEWGIIDTWRRKKPEFWSTKKAYSPTKILVKQITEFESGKELRIPIYNRFDHTNFTELNIKWEHNSLSGVVSPTKIEPHEKGELIIPSNNWKEGEIINISFYNRDNMLIDIYNLRLGQQVIKSQKLENGSLNVTEHLDHVSISGNNYIAKINKSNGLLEDLISHGDTLIKSGPYLNLLAFDKGDWATVPFFDKATKWDLKNFSYSTLDGQIVINTSGMFNDSISTKYTIQINGNGQILIDYSAENAPTGKLIRECGIKFLAGNKLREINWDRNSYWSAYPEYHLGMPEGKLELNDYAETNYRELPSHQWERDINDFYYQGIEYKLPLSKIALSTKENIYSFGLKAKNGASITVFDSGEKACRIDKTVLGYNLYINDEWDYASLKWGNYQKNIKFENQFMGNVNLQIR